MLEETDHLFVDKLKRMGFLCEQKGLLSFRSQNVEVYSNSYHFIAKRKQNAWILMQAYLSIQWGHQSLTFK